MNLRARVLAALELEADQAALAALEIFLGPPRASPICSEGWMTFVTSGRLASQAATAEALSQWRSMRSGSVSMPCRVRKALNGDMPRRDRAAASRAP